MYVCMLLPILLRDSSGLRSSAFGRTGTAFGGPKDVGFTADVCGLAGKSAFTGLKEVIGEISVFFGRVKENVFAAPPALWLDTGSFEEEESAAEKLGLLPSNGKTTELTLAGGSAPRLRVPSPQE